MGLYSFDQIDPASLVSPSPGRATLLLDQTDGKAKIRKPDGSYVILDDQQPTPLATIRTPAGPYTVQDTDQGAIIEAVADVTLPISPAIGTTLQVYNLGVSTVQIIADAGATILAKDLSRLTLLNKYDRAILYKSTATQWVVIGDLSSNDVPPQVPGLLAWYDMSTQEYLSVASGFISVLFDRSGNNYHAIQTTASRQAEFIAFVQNSLGIARFSGADSYPLNTVVGDAMLSDCTVLAVSKQNVASENGSIVMARNGNDPITGIQYNSGTNKSRYWSKGSDTVVGGFDNQTFHSFALNQYSATFDSWRDGVVVDSGDNSGVIVSKQAYIGATRETVENLTGDVGEVIFYNRSLLSSEMTTIFNYLSEKWGL